MDAQQALERIGAGTAAIVLGFAAGSVLEYALKVVLARSLQPERYGAFMQSFALVHLAVVLSLVGLNHGLPRMMSYFSGREEGGKERSAAMTAAIIVLPPAVLITIGIRIGAGTVASIFSEPLMVTPLRVMALGILPMALFYLCTASLRGLQNARLKVYLEDLLQPGLELGLVLGLFFLLGASVRGAAYAFLFAGLAASVVGLVVVYRRVAALQGGFRFIPRELLLFAWPLLVVAVVTAVNRWIDVLMLGWLSTSADAGIYEVAMAVAGFLLLFLSSVRYMFLPVASELYGRGRTDRLGEVYSITTRWLMIFAVPVFVGMAVFPGHILTLLFGQGYTAGDTVVRILIAGYLFASLVGPAGMVLVAAGRTRLLMWAFLLLGAADVVLNLLLIPRFGMEGAALAMTAAFVGANALMVGSVYRVSGMHPFTSGQLRVAAAGALALLPMAGVLAVTPDTLPAAFAAGALFTAVYAVGVYLLGGVSPGDRDIVETLFSSV